MGWEAVSQHGLPSPMVLDEVSLGGSTTPVCDLGDVPLPSGP